MELTPYAPIAVDPSTLLFLDEMQFLRLNPIYQARVLPVENIIKEMISWHNVFINDIFSVIPLEHEWNKEHSRLFIELSRYQNAAEGVFLENVQTRDWCLYGIYRLLPLVYSKAEDLTLLNEKQRFLWNIFLQAGRRNTKYEYIFNQLKGLCQQMEDHTRLCQRMLTTLSSYYHYPNLWANPIDLNSAPPGEE